VKTDRELLLSLHQKVDRNHKWVKRQFGAILQNMTVTQNTVKKNHYYLHEVFDRTWAILSNLYGAEELKEMGFQ
jgi:phosphoribosyl-dephospho-CoA transferase